MLGGSLGGDGAGANGFSFAGLNGTTGTVGTETVNYSWAGNTLTATGPRACVVHDRGDAFDRRLHADAAGQRAACGRRGRGKRDRSDHEPDLLDHRRRRLVGDRHADRDLGRRRADGDHHATQNVNEGATVTGTLAFVQGADGASVTHIGGIPLVFNPGRNFSQPIDIGMACSR